jgi:hypothetical protein
LAVSEVGVNRGSVRVEFEVQLCKSFISWLSASGRILSGAFCGRQFSCVLSSPVLLLRRVLVLGSVQFDNKCFCVSYNTPVSPLDPNTLDSRRRSDWGCGFTQLIEEKEVSKLAVLEGLSDTSSNSNVLDDPEFENNSSEMSVIDSGDISSDTSSS